MPLPQNTGRRFVARPNRAQFRGDLVGDAVEEDHVMRQRVDRPPRPVSIPNGDKREQHVGRDNAAVMVSDEEYRSGFRQVLDALALPPKVVVAEEAKELEDQTNELGIAIELEVRHRSRSCSRQGVSDHSGDNGRRREMTQIGGEDVFSCLAEPVSHLVSLIEHLGLYPLMDPLFFVYSGGQMN